MTDQSIVPPSICSRSNIFHFSFVAANLRNLIRWDVSPWWQILAQWQKCGETVNICRLMRPAGGPRHNAAPEIVRDACPISSVLRISQIADKTDKPGVTCFITNTLCGQGRRGQGETDSSYLIFWIIRLFLKLNHTLLFVAKEKKWERQSLQIFLHHRLFF